MAKLLRLRRGTDTQHTTFTGAEGEVTVNTTNDSLHVHDGSTAGGTELAKADLSNVDGSLSNNLGFADNTKALFGTGNDLEIYHNGSNSIIEDVGTGNLVVKGANVQLNSDVVKILNNANDEDLAKFNANGSVQLFYDNSEKLNTTSTGINVTGSVTCDGITSDGDININVVGGGLYLKDTNGAGSAATPYIIGRDSANTIEWLVGAANPADGSLTLINHNSDSLLFGTGNTNRCLVNASGHFIPYVDDTYDLGTSSNQWRNGYFDGTVYCDGLTVNGAATVQSTIGQIEIFDTNNTGSASECLIRAKDAGSNNLWYYGTGGGDSNLYVWNYQNGNTQFATNNTLRAEFTSAGHFVPGSNNTYDLGTSSLRWRNVYTNDLNLSNEGGANDVDGTWGSWTIQEGEDDLFLLNRRNGKKYKFNLSEVN